MKKGDVYFSVHRGLTSPKPHFCIIVNDAAGSGKRVVLTFATSQLETRLAIARRNHYPKETLVQIAPSQYEPFDRLTVIDCNSVQVDDASELEANLKAVHAKKKPKLPQSILDRIIRGIHASPRSTPEMLKLIGPPPPVTIPALPKRGLKITVK